MLPDRYHGDVVVAKNTFIEERPDACSSISSLIDKYLPPSFHCRLSFHVISRVSTYHFLMKTVVVSMLDTADRQSIE